MSWQENVRASLRQLDDVFRTILRNQARPSPPANVRKYRRARSDASWTTSSASSSLFISHRASRYCHQFHLLASGGGPEHDEPAFAQTKINRALEDAPFAPPLSIVPRLHSRANGYTLEAFLPAAALNGYDPEQ